LFFSDPCDRLIGRQLIGYCLTLIAASLGLLMMRGAGTIYLAGALLLGIGFLACVAGYARQRSMARARVVLRTSLIYLPALLTLLLLE
jgi:heme o synthase